MLRRRSLLNLLMAFALLAAISLQPVSVAVSSMLGQRHVHREAISAPIVLGLVGNWHGGSRVAHGELLTEVRHVQSHLLGLRHHHAMDDGSVVPLEPAASSDGSPVGENQVTAPLVFVEGRETELPLTGEAAEANWSKLSLLPIANPYPRRIERPPSLIA